MVAQCAPGMANDNGKSSSLTANDPATPARSCRCQDLHRCKGSHCVQETRASESVAAECRDPIKIKSPSDRDESETAQNERAAE